MMLAGTILDLLSTRTLRELTKEIFEYIAIGNGNIPTS